MDRFLLVVLSVSYLENIGVAVFPGEDGIHWPLYPLPVPGDLTGVPLVYTLTIQSVVVLSWKRSKSIYRIFLLILFIKVKNVPYFDLTFYGIEIHHTFKGISTTVLGSGNSIKSWIPTDFRNAGNRSFGWLGNNSLAGGLWFGFLSWCRCSWNNTRSNDQLRTCVIFLVWYKNVRC